MSVTADESSPLLRPASPRTLTLNRMLTWRRAFYVLAGALMAAVVLCIALQLSPPKAFAPAQTPVGAPPPYAHREHPMRPASGWGAVSRPYPTGAFWTNWVLGDGAMPVATLPYAASAHRAAGIQVSYPAYRRVHDPHHVSDAFAPDLALRSKSGGRLTARGVERYDDLTATLTAGWEGGGTALAHLAKVRVSVFAVVVVVLLRGLAASLPGCLAASCAASLCASLPRSLPPSLLPRAPRT